MAQKLALAGKRFGHLTVVIEEGKDRHGSWMWRCACDCGATAVARASELKRGTVVSCGCRRGSEKCPPGCTCNRHQRQPELADRAQWKGTDANHRSRHRRVYRRRGKAAEHPCTRCLENGISKQACDWAQVHDTEGTDPWADFVALCRRCHLHYDRDARQAPEAMGRWREAVGPSLSTAWTPERRAARSRYMTDYWAARRGVTDGRE